MRGKNQFVFRTPPCYTLIIFCPKWKPQLFRSLFSASTSDIQATKRDVYAFDQFSLSPLHSVGGFHPGTSRRPPIFIFQRDPLYEWPSTSRDWIELHLTLGKLLEVFILRRLNAGILAWVTALSWSYFFMSATLLQYMQLSRGYGRDLDNSGRLDIISGKLPTARRPGGECRILLGAPGNFRQHVVWRIVWTLGILISSVYIVSCYILLASRPPKVVYAWVGFHFGFCVDHCSSISPRVQTRLFAPLCLNVAGMT